LQALQQRTI
jgi:hypothetical protein